MKRLFYIIGLVMIVLSLNSCTKWLEGKTSQSEELEEEQYRDQAGFATALMGVYSYMADTELYGERATMYIPEMIIGNWRGKETSSTEGRFNDYNNGNNRGNETVESILEGMFIHFYKAIAQVNSVIDHLESTNKGFEGEDERLILMGEAYGLRAFLHLDLLRFFGPSPEYLGEVTIDPVTNEVKPAPSDMLSYVTKVSNTLEDLAPCTSAEYIGKLSEDLEKSIAYLKDRDPIFRYRQEGTGSQAGVPINPLWNNRKIRFNYWAAIATKARMESWLGNSQTAAELALSIIDNAKTIDGKILFPLSSRASSVDAVSGQNYTMNSEHIFAVQNERLYDRLEDRYRGAIEALGMGFSRRGWPIYAAKFEDIEKLYGDLIKGEDWRGTAEYYWKRKEDQDDNIYTYHKYINDLISTSSSNQLNRVPLIRISEMYFLVFEGLSTSDSKIKNKIREYANARGIFVGVPLITEKMEDALKNEVDGQISKEYRKEFYAEGQAYFYYKRFNYKQLSWPKAYPESGNVSRLFWQLDRPEGNYMEFYPEVFGL